MRCQEQVADGEQCKRDAEEGREYCWQHPRGEGPTSIPTEAMIEAVKRFRGGLYMAAEHLNCSYNQIRARAKTNEELARVIEIEQGKIDDRAELGLVKAIQDGEAWAIRFRLKHKARGRGYSEKREIDHTSSDGSMSPVSSRAQILERMEGMDAAELAKAWRDVDREVDGDDDE